MNGEKHCAICDTPISAKNDSSEHVIPNSIGGRLKVRGFICSVCNNGMGQTWDAVLASQLNWFSLALGTLRERGHAPAQAISTVDGTELRLQADGTMTRSEPYFRVTERDGIASFKIFARTPDEARQMMRGIKKKYPQFDLERALQNLVNKPFKVESPEQHRIEFGGPQAGRSIVKTALAYSFYIGILPSMCAAAVDTLRNPYDDRGFAHFYIVDLLVSRPASELFHIISIHGNSKTGELRAYIEFYGAMRFVVKLGNNFDAVGFTSTYSVNAQSGQRANLQVNWQLAEGHLDAAFSGHGIVLENLDRACKIAIAIASRSRRLRERHHVNREAVSDVLTQLGLQPGEKPHGEDRDRFNRLMEERLGPLGDFYKDIPSLPDFE